MAAHVSLAAALEMIRQHIESERGKDVAYDDVYGYVEDAFPGGALVDFLRDTYDLRTMLVHPSSRFGEYWAPPMQADDVFEIIEWLVPLYRHILTGEALEGNAA